MDAAPSALTPTLCVSSQKGGVSKTTTAVSLAHLFSLSMKVLLIDLDTQGSSGVYLGTDTQRGIYHYAKGEALASLVRQARPNLDLLGANDAAALDAPLSKFSRSKLKDLFSEAQTQAYDLVIMDLSPSLNRLSIAALVAASHILVPVTPGPAGQMGLDALKRTLQQVGSVFSYTPTISRTTPVMVDMRTRASVELLARHPHEYIRVDQRLQECVGGNMTIFEYDATSKGARDYTALGEAVYEDIFRD